MPELPEIELYLHALRARVVHRRLDHFRIVSPSVLRTFHPPPGSVEGCTLLEVSRLGKRVVLHFENELLVIIHLMLTGRFRWLERGKTWARRNTHAAVEFDTGTLLLTEAGTRKKASIHVVAGADALEAFQRGGIEPLTASASEFATALTAENRTVKRALTDPRIISGIGNAHSDEILFRARISPARRTRQLEPAELQRLHEVTIAWLTEWSHRLLAETGDAFPGTLSARHPALAIHGRYGQPCVDCGHPIQRIVYAGSETNYCAHCQTGGRLLADRAFSRLLGEDWPRTLDELER